MVINRALPKASGSLDNVGTVAPFAVQYLEEQEIFSFTYPSRPAQGPTQLPVQHILGLFTGGKTAGISC
jgi:hypothetical protein